MSDQIIIDLGTKAVVRLQSADGLIEHKLFSAYSTWPYDAIEKSFRENIKRLEIKEKKQFHLYLNADTYSKKETVDVYTLSIGLFNALQKESNSDDTLKLTVIFSTEEFQDCDLCTGSSDTGVAKTDDLCEFCDNCHKPMPRSRTGKLYHYQQKCRPSFPHGVIVGDEPAVRATKGVTPALPEVHTPAQPSGKNTAKDGTPVEYHNGSHPLSKKGTVEYYHSKLDEPIYKGASHTLREYLNDMFGIYASTNITKRGFEAILKNCRELSQECDPIIPKSLYLVKEILGIPTRKRSRTIDQ